MGEIAEMLLEGTMDFETGEYNFDGEDGPGWPMTGAEAATHRREADGQAFARYRSGPRRPFVTERRTLGPRPQKPRKPVADERPLFGLWRDVALTIQEGATEPAQIGAAMDRPAAAANVLRCLQMMKVSGLSHNEHGLWRLTKRGLLRLSNPE